MWAGCGQAYDTWRKHSPTPTWDAKTGRSLCADPATSEDEQVDQQQVRAVELEQVPEVGDLAILVHREPDVDL